MLWHTYHGTHCAHIEAERHLKTDDFRRLSKRQFPRGSLRKGWGNKKGHSSFLHPSDFRNLHPADATRVRGPRCWGEHVGGKIGKDIPLWSREGWLPSARGRRGVDTAPRRRSAPGQQCPRAPPPPRPAPSGAPRGV